ncbi:MAG TPA: hypothetical protein IAD38_06495 [Candidatus Egerieenecus merdigallinarum]|nr:hypothetical protein [Candidatus Egerieenecus merdigallinarum]
MKKLLAIILAAIMALSGVGMAVAEEESVTWTLSILVRDVNGQPLHGAEITVKDITGELVYSGVSDASGQVETSVAMGTYAVRATDPQTGYSAQETMDMLGDTEMEIVIRTLVPGSKITVGSVTKVAGQFSTDMFGNNTSDIDIRALLHGYSTVAYTDDASYTLDETVAQVDVATEDDFGNKVYVFHVNDGLTYNDGTPITAKDYAFSVLLQSAPQMAELGASTSGYWHIQGYDQYASGERNYLSGVRLLDDMTFSLTIRANALPYYYELTYVNVTPYPISVIAPGCTVEDDGDGAYIDGEFTTAVLEKTMLDPETGYCSHPMVTSGPYQLESYNGETGEVVLKANTRYVGNYAGQRPLIETVVLRETTNAQALAELADGTLDIVNKISDSQVIAEGVAQLSQGTLQASNYLRSGLGFLALACEQGPTSQENIRKAISYCLDQDAFVTAFTGTYGQPVYSWYGLGQWMASEYVSTAGEDLNTYEMNLDTATTLVERAGYVYNAEGDAFREGEDTVRYRLLRGTALNEYNALEDPVVEAVQVGNKNLLPLEIKFARVENNRMCDLVVEQLVPNLEAIGFKVEVVNLSFEDMLAQYYREVPRECNMFALATNFTHVFDPIYTWDGEAQYQGYLNTTGIDSARLARQAARLRGTTPGDTERYLQRWQQLMTIFNDELPDIPLYSNMYFDFYANRVQNYAANAHWSWSAAILYTWVAEPEETEDQDALTQEAETEAPDLEQITDGADAQP